MFRYKSMQMLTELSRVDPSHRAPIFFRCQACLRFLTWKSAKRIPCLSSRWVLGPHGKWVPAHIPGFNFSLFDQLPNPLAFSTVRSKSGDELLSELRSQFKSWGMCYWCLWNASNFLLCDRCHKYLQPADIGSGCSYHAIMPVRRQRTKIKQTTASSPTKESARGTADDVPGTNKAIKEVYPCCGHECVKFDLLSSDEGCLSGPHKVADTDLNVSTVQLSKRAEEHLRPFVVRLKESLENDVEGPSVGAFRKSRQCVSLLPSSIRRQLLQDCRNGTKLEVPQLGFFIGEISISRSGRNLCSMKICSKLETSNSQSTQIHHIPKRTQTMRCNLWNPTKASRSNQDIQRQDDARRTKHLIEFLTSFRHMKCDSTKQQNPSPQNQKRVGIINRLHNLGERHASHTTGFPSLLRSPRINQSVVPFR